MYMYQTIYYNYVLNLLKAKAETDDTDMRFDK